MSDPQPTVRSEMSGIAGHVVQAGDVHGGVHLHQAKSSDAGPPRQLPADVRGFVNRVVELGRLDRLLDDRTPEFAAPAVVLIAGTAGVGKTSLAVHWAQRVRNLFPDGQLYINLRGYDPGAPVTPESALNLFLQALGVRASAIPSDPQAKAMLYRSLLADRRVLVVLDNAATVSQVRPLLPGTASCLVLVTSRNRMPGLVSRDGAVRVTVDVLDDSEAVTLLRNLVEEHRGDDDLEELNELSHLCARLPLALRIAAERAATRPWMALSELIHDLRDESALWGALSSADDDEADAVRTVFAWSYRALPNAAAQLFRRLGLHPGAEFGLGAAAALAGLNTGAARHVLDVLLAGHLLEQVGPDRYQLHDLLRAYAIDQVRHDEPPDEQRAAIFRLLSWYLSAAEQAYLSVSRGGRHLKIDVEAAELPSAPEAFADREQALAWYGRERSNLMAATRVAAECGFDRIAWQIPGTLAVIYDNHDSADVWLATERAALEAARRVGDRYGQGVLLDRQGIKFRKLRRADEALDCFREALEVFEFLGNGLGKARVTNGMGVVHMEAERLQEARASFERAITAEPLSDGETSMRALATVNLGDTHLKLGSPEEALRCVADAMPTLRRLDDVIVELVATRVQGVAQRELGMLAESRASFQTAVELIRRAGNLIAECEVFLELARLEIAEGSPADALVSAQRAIVIAQQFSVTTVEAQGLDVTGIAYQELGRQSDAVPFHRRAVELCRAVGDVGGVNAATLRLSTALESEEREQR
ncbi:tetratricopeptide repeat protein [Lentzea sp. PSKA42]|uniref:Tetratricopeptide repeat protein n=1 Tax=Lentzea indica TaxID=2604800 RepID=A0ABX1FG54_9PSEU|nr:tetratricopeptide repeat protein [Lentzea indica]NKE57716.1 tetratricopeptide repeat protein [Lentzea indica]